MSDKQITCIVCKIKMWISESDYVEGNDWACGKCVRKIGKLLVDSKKFEPEKPKDKE